MCIMLLFLVLLVGTAASSLASYAGESSMFIMLIPRLTPDPSAREYY